MTAALDLVGWLSSVERAFRRMGSWHGQSQSQMAHSSHYASAHAHGAQALLAHCPSSDCTTANFCSKVQKFHDFLVVAQTACLKLCRPFMGRAATNAAPVTEIQYARMTQGKAASIASMIMGAHAQLLLSCREVCNFHAPRSLRSEKGKPLRRLPLSQRVGAMPVTRQL